MFGTSDGFFIHLNSWISSVDLSWIVHAGLKNMVFLRYPGKFLWRLNEIKWLRGSVELGSLAGCIETGNFCINYSVVLEHDIWTSSLTGCQCYFNPLRFDCACCKGTAVQCPCDNRHQCVQRSALRSTNCGIRKYDKTLHGWWLRSCIILCDKTYCMHSDASILVFVRLLGTSFIMDH